MTKKNVLGILMLFAGMFGIALTISSMWGIAHAGSFLKIPYAVVGNSEYVLVEWVRSPPEVGGAIKASLQDNKLGWVVDYRDGPCWGGLGRTRPDRRWAGFGYGQFEGLPGTDVASSVYRRIDASVPILFIISLIPTAFGLWLVDVLRQTNKRKGFDVVSTPVL